MTKKWQITDHGEPEYLDGALMQITITEGEYPGGTTIAYCDPENAHVLVAAKEMLATLQWLRRTYGGSFTPTMKARINATLARAEGRKK